MHLPVPSTWMPGWWFQICFIFTPIWGNGPIWNQFAKHMFQRGWFNHLIYRYNIYIYNLVNNGINYLHLNWFLAGFQPSTVVPSTWMLIRFGFSPLPAWVSQFPSGVINCNGFVFSPFLWDGYVCHLPPKRSLDTKLSGFFGEKKTKKVGDIGFIWCFIILKGFKH